MSASQRLARFGLYLWQGPDSLPRSLQLEWRFVALRWFGIAIMVPVLLLTQLPPMHRLIAFGILGLAVVYNAAIQVMMPRRPTIFLSGYFTAFGDGLLNLAIINAGGGFDSPFYYLLFSIAIATAMRYGYGPSLALVLMVACLDLLWRGLAQQIVDATFLLRGAFLLMAAFLASYLRGEARQAETALQERLRQTSLLNEATALLGASLNDEEASVTVARATAHLFGGGAAVFCPIIDAEHAHHSPRVSQTAGADPLDDALAVELGAVCGKALDGAAGDTRPDLFMTSLSSGHLAVVLVLDLPGRRAPVGAVAVALPLGQPVQTRDPDIIASFRERTTLAIEKATIYRTLVSRTHDLQRAYRDLAVAHQDLLSVDEMKTNFLANVSHELRTPLSSIRSFSELLLTYDNAPAIQREFIQIINSESERLSRLVNDVLDISKIEAGKMDWKMTTVEVTVLVEESIRPYAMLMRDLGLAFEQHIDADLPPIHADRDRLQQVISNLLTNAIKFTPAGTVGLQARRINDEVRISVSDTGIGIAPEDHERIFEKFQQVGDTLTDKPRGTGLGLCICREIIAHHQGELWVESQLGVGSTFTFSLPLMVAATRLPARAAHAA